MLTYIIIFVTAAVCSTILVSVNLICKAYKFGKYIQYYEIEDMEELR